MTIWTLDARVKIGLTLVLGWGVWQAGPVGLTIFSLGALWLARTLAARTGPGRAALMAGVRFAALWTVAKYVVDRLSGADMALAALQGGILGWRLGLLVIFGLALALTTSSRQLGLALAWALRPFLGRAAWKPALAMALMLHFLPIIHAASSRIRQAMALRGPGLSRRQRLVIWPQALLRAMGQATWTQTLAIAARGLDAEDAWRAGFASRPMDWWVGAGLTACAILTSLA